IDNLQEIIQQHAAQIAGLEKEREFYYQKLREVEMVCQEPEHEPLPHAQKILEILYTTEEGFAQPDQENDTYELHNENINNDNGAGLIAGDDETY
ncbi:unnamed protein product, partial [Adineta steineri]